MRIIFCLMVFLFIGKNTMLAQQLSSFVEYGTTLHTGDNTPLWQVSNQQGLTSLDNNTYIRGGISYKHQLGKWKFEEALDLVAAAGFSTTSFIVQQAYVDIRYKWFGFFAGSREQNSPLLNQELSSGGMTWSGNARPIPQVQIGIPEYVQLLPRLGLKGEISYGWFTDNKYQREQVGEKYWYTKSIKYHHKEGFLRIGIPKGKWQLELGMTLDTQFGGYKIGGSESGDLGNGWKDYVRVFFPGHGREDGPVGEHLAFQGNFLGSEYIKMTYRPKEDFSISAYLDNHFDDFSAMAKLNGWDGLWGVEYKSNHRQAINGIVIEYLQTTNMSGPLHGLQNSVVRGMAAGLLCRRVPGLCRGRGSSAAGCGYPVEGTESRFHGRFDHRQGACRHDEELLAVFAGDARPRAVRLRDQRPAVAGRAGAVRET